MAVSQTFINYVLKCNDGKIYVGRTTRSIDIRFAEHLEGKGSEWTKRYRPIQVIQTTGGDKWEEDALVLKYMEQYGIDNVRGGSYSTMELTTDQRRELSTTS